MTKIKDGDLYSYANVHINSHGFMVKTNEDFCYEVEVTDWKGVEILTCSSGSSSNVVVKEDEVGKLVRDRRLESDSMVMVYRSGRTREQVLEALMPQVGEQLILRKSMYDMLSTNASEMAWAALGHIKDPELEEHGNYLCSSAPGKQGRK